MSVKQQEVSITSSHRNAAIIVTKPLGNVHWTSVLVVFSWPRTVEVANGATPGEAIVNAIRGVRSLAEDVGPPARAFMEQVEATIATWTDGMPPEGMATGPTTTAAGDDDAAKKEGPR